MQTKITWDTIVILWNWLKWESQTVQLPPCWRGSGTETIPWRWWMCILAKALWKLATLIKAVHFLSSCVGADFYSDHFYKPGHPFPNFCDHWLLRSHTFSREWLYWQGLPHLEMPIMVCSPSGWGTQQSMPGRWKVTEVLRGWLCSTIHPQSPMESGLRGFQPAMGWLGSLSSSSFPHHPIGCSREHCFCKSPAWQYSAQALLWATWPKLLSSTPQNRAHVCTQDTSKDVHGKASYNRHPRYPSTI